MRRYTFLRILVHLRRTERLVARRVAVVCTAIFAGSWWLLSTLALTGIAWVIGAAALAVSAVGGAVAWWRSGE